MTEKTTAESPRLDVSLVEAATNDGVEMSGNPIIEEFPQAHPFDEHNWPMTCSTECHFLHMVQFPVNRELMLTGLC